MVPQTDEIMTLESAGTLARSAPAPGERLQASPEASKSAAHGIDGRTGGEVSARRRLLLELG